MCSIIGWNGNFNEALVERICRNSRIRGLHSFGYCFYKDGKLQLKKFLDYDLFLGELLKDKPNKFIAHFRYSTSGDYKDEKNNQPIVRENLAMVFNGVLDMRTKSKMELQNNVKLISDNDGELALVKRLESKESFISFLFGKSFAGAFLNENNEIEIYRNSNRPAQLGCYKGVKILASTKDILERSGVKNSKELKSNNLIKL